MKNRFIRITSLVLCLAMLLPMAVACKKDPEPEVPETPEEEDPRGDQAKYDYVFKIDDSASEKVLLTNYNTTVSGGVIDPEIRHEGEAVSFNWRADYGSASNGATVSSVLVNNWSEYDAITMWIYSHKACGGKIQIRFSSPNTAGTSMDPYFRTLIDLDWEGWKEITVPIESMKGNYSPDLNNVVKICFDNKGWEMDSDPNNRAHGGELNFGYMYLVKTKYTITPSVESIGKDAFSKPKDKWRELLVGTAATNSSGTDNVNAKIASINRNCKSTMDQFNDTFSASTRDSLFGISVTQGNAGDESKINDIYSKLLNMAIGYATPGSDYYQDNKLYNNIRMGLEYCYKFYYGPNVWEQGTYGNWWYWDIGIPLNLTKILILIEERLGATLVKKYLEPFDYLDKYPSMTACNKTWITYCVFASALLQEDAERMMISQTKFVDVFDYVNSGDGFYTDGSFIQHEKHPYTGGYALSMLTTLTDIMYVLNETRFEIIPDIYPNVNNQYDWVFENFQPVMYDGLLFAGMRGREVFRNTSETAAGNSAVYSMIKMAQYAPAETKAKLESLLKHFFITGTTAYENGAPICLSDYTANLINDDSVAARADYNITKSLGMMDRVVTHNAKYAASISISSTRIFKYEAINNENMDGWYLGDGMIYIYTDGYDFNYNFFNYSDPYKMPGTTVTEETRKQENLSGGIHNGSAFAGGVSIGEYGIAVYDQVPASNKYFTSKLSARKSYFIFDNEIVAVGSGIKDSSRTEVNTIVENRLWRDGDKLYVNGSALSPTGNQTYTKTDITSMHFSNMGGYVFLDKCTVKYKKSDISVDFMEIWIAHGKSPSGAKYSYVYLPEATPEETVAYEANPDVEILAQTNKIHAVKETKLGITGYAFYEAGNVNGVTTDKALTLMVKESADGTVTVAVSDPTHLLTSATVTIELSKLGTEVTSSDNITATVSGNTLTLNIDFTGNVGESFIVTVK